MGQVGIHSLPSLSGGLQCRGSVTGAPLVKAIPMWIPLRGVPALFLRLSVLAHPSPLSSSVGGRMGPRSGSSVLRPSPLPSSMGLPAHGKLSHG